MLDVIFMRKLFGVYKNFCAFVILGIILCSDAFGQLPTFRKHEVIDAGNGMKVEILSCRGEGDSEECDVIYYTDKRQLGKRMWEKSLKLREMKLAATMVKNKTVVQKPITQKPVLKKPVESKSIESKPVNKPLEQVATIEPKKESVTTSIGEKISTDFAVEIANTNAANIAEKDSAVKAQNKFGSSDPNNALAVSNSLPMRYTLANCYAVAKERSLTLRQAQNNIYNFEIDRKIAKSNYLPSLAYNIGHYFSFGKNIDPVTNTFSYESFSGGYTALAMQLELFSGFNRVNTVKQTEFSIRSAEYSKKKFELELLSNITLTYARILLDKEQLAVERSIIASTSKEIEVINEKIRVGRLSKYEFYTFNARLNTQQANIVTLQNDSLAAVHDLKELLNVAQSERVDVVPVDTTLLLEIYSNTISPSDYIMPILKNHPAIKQAEMDKQVAVMGEKISKSNYYPSLSLGGNVSSNYNANQISISGSKVPLSTQLNDNIGQNININLRVPIFSQNENANRVKKERINISNAELAQQAAINLITSQTFKLVNDFNGARQKYAATKSAWEQNRLSYDLHIEKYRVGQISSVELLAAQDTYNRATSQYVQTKLQLFFQYQLLELLKSYN